MAVDARQQSQPRPSPEDRATEALRYAGWDENLPGAFRLHAAFALMALRGRSSSKRGRSPAGGIDTGKL